MHEVVFQSITGFHWIRRDRPELTGLWGAKLRFVRPHGNAKLMPSSNSGCIRQQRLDPGVPTGGPLQVQKVQTQPLFPKPGKMYGSQ